MARHTSIPSEFYGDNPRWFTGLVIDARPPENKGLEGYVRVRIHGVHSPSLADIPEGDLPWAQVMIPTTEGGTSGLGSTPRIEAGTLVFGFFMDGQFSQTPIILGSLPHMTTPTPIQLGFDPINSETAGVESIEMDLEGVDNENTGEIDEETRTRRQEESIKELMRNGMSFESAVAVTAAFDVKGGMITGEHPDGSFGIDNFSGERAQALKDSGPDYQNFDKQVSFVNNELNSTQSQKTVEMGNTMTSKANALADNAKQATQIKNKTTEILDNLGGGG